MVTVGLYATYEEAEAALDAYNAANAPALAEGAPPARLSHGERVLAALKPGVSVSAYDVATKAQVSRERASRGLSALLQQGLVERTDGRAGRGVPNGGGATYRLVEKAMVAS